MDKIHCLGCEDDFYNGKNPLGVKECWGLKTAEMIWRKKVHINQRPPWNQGSTMYPRCYKLKRHVFVKPEQVR